MTKKFHTLFQMTKDSKIIYLDNNATTRCDPAVVDAMLPYYSEVYGNPGNGYHLLGRLSKTAVDNSREKIGELIGANGEDVIFTSGATESNNIAIMGLLDNHYENPTRKKIITSSIEHKAILNIFPKYKKLDYEIIILPVNQAGEIDIDLFSNTIDENTILVSIQIANNEIGTIQNIQKLADKAHECGAIFHSDGTQAIGKIPVDIEKTGLDMISMSAHKFYGPKGIGALAFRNSTIMRKLIPQFFGGGQERNLRPGTNNVPGIVGMGEAARICNEVMGQETDRIEKIRNKFEKRLSFELLNRIVIHAKSSIRIPNTSSIEFSKKSGDEILLGNRVFAAGIGSACSFRTIDPSHVLTAIGLNHEQANSTIRFSFGRFNTMEEIDTIVDSILEMY